jgi:hypothetical protein
MPDFALRVLRAMTAVRHWLVQSFDWILMIVLVALAFLAVRYPPSWRAAAPSGSLAGALFSGAAVLLANAINRSNQRAQAYQESRRRRQKLERLDTYCCWMYRPSTCW